MPTEPAEQPRRARMVRGGPLMIEGPVELVDADGNTVLCERFQVAVCMCRRSKRYPICDTSHRPRKSPEK
ncbi:hypothetical protein GCM10022247_51570 [Allokutzneria multivorans]|uniref:Iron-binding zinc finger CDGSH type domain-containing protein n=1 Tax=Allokutzneria multivorans TaxID=1142134 RepID=A0ABP7T4Y2_9PSEU